MRTQYFWPIIHHTCDKRFYDTEFAVDSKDLQREESHLDSVGGIGNRMLLTETAGKAEAVVIYACRDCPLTSEEINLWDVWKDYLSAFRFHGNQIKTLSARRIWSDVVNIRKAAEEMRW